MIPGHIASGSPSPEPLLPPSSPSQAHLSPCRREQSLKSKRDQGHTGIQLWCISTVSNLLTSKSAGLCSISKVKAGSKLHYRPWDTVVELKACI